MSTHRRTRGPVARPAVPPEPAPAEPNYLNVNYGIWSWLLTVDHKRIGILYLMSITRLLRRRRDRGRAWSGSTCSRRPGRSWTRTQYNRAFTAHGVDDAVLLPDPGRSRR